MIMLDCTVTGRIYQGHKCRHTYSAGTYVTEEAMVAAVTRWRADLNLVCRELAVDFASVTSASFKALKVTSAARGRRVVETRETWPVMAGRRRVTA